MGGTKVNYNPPPPDDTFSKYLTYQQELHLKLLGPLVMLG
jgi:hypothetical protein